MQYKSSVSGWSWQLFTAQQALPLHAIKISPFNLYYFYQRRGNITRNNEEIYFRAPYPGMEQDQSFTQRYHPFHKSLLKSRVCVK
jgi:hypothetical protein